MKSFLTIFSFFFFFAFGYYISFHAKDFPSRFIVEEAPRTARDPAAIKKVYDFSTLDGEDLHRAARERLISGARVLHSPEALGIEFGHFVLKGNEGPVDKDFACEHYSKLILSFEGEGYAVAGEKPKMEVEGQCEMSGDINAISAIWIPVKRILSETVADGEFDYRDQNPVRVRFFNVAEQWPKLWHLYSVKLHDPNNKYREVEVGPQAFREIHKKPFMLNFSEVQ